MSLPGAATDLGQAWKTACLAWEEAQTGWHDPVSQDFDDNHWTPLENHVLAVIQAMERLAPVLARAVRDCSE
jgi:hypothetical protein